MQVDTTSPRPTSGSSSAGCRRTSPSTRTRASGSRARSGRSATRRTTVQNVVTYDAVIDVDNADLKLRPGMTANVTFVYAEQEGRARGAERGAALPARRPRRTSPSRAAASPRRPRAARGGARAKRRAPARRRPGAGGKGEGRPRRDGAGRCATAARAGLDRRRGLSDGAYTESSAIGEHGGVDRRRPSPRSARGRLSRRATRSSSTPRSPAKTRPRRRPRATARRLPVLSGSATSRSSSSTSVTKVYRTGDVEVHALRGVTLADRRAASSSRSWARRARASRR